MIKTVRIMKTIRFVFILIGIKVDEFNIKSSIIRNLIHYKLRYFYILRQFALLYWIVSKVFYKIKFK